MEGQSAAWYPDPGGTHQLRYWDSQRWSDHVSDHRVVSTDPMPALPVAPVALVVPAVDIQHAVGLGGRVTPRLRRLAMDAELLRIDFRDHPYIRVTPVGWQPAEKYAVEYRVRGVVLMAGSSQPTFAESFVASITLPMNYPRVKPLCTMESPVFHPNFGSRIGDEICIADYWTPSQSLSDIVIKIGEMLQYQNYNVKSPLNAAAARWADGNRDHLPVGLTRIARSAAVDRSASPTTSTN
jgi:ubiquitin-protein ligase